MQTPDRGRLAGVLLTIFWFISLDPLVANSKPRALPPLDGPILNLDSSAFFYDHTAAQMNGGAIDAYIDLVARTGFRTFITCVNAQKTNYASRVWEADWIGYDPSGPDDQPVLRHLPPATIPATRQRLDSAKRLADLSINLHDRLLKRCRQRGLGAWVSVRMNDVHDCLLEDSPLLSDFYKKQRAAHQLRASISESEWWADRGLDWARTDVQEHYYKLVIEQLETLDIDGLELDWMRSVYHFRPGHELAGGRIITEWMRRVRTACNRASVRLGHPVMLGVRVPSQPETARRCGLDGVAWAREGLVDLVVPTPYWATTDFDMPMGEWKRLLAGTGARLAGGIEMRYQPIPNGPADMMSAETTAGAALSLLYGGADFVYLFNYDPHLLLRLNSPKGSSKLWPKDSLSTLGHALRMEATLAALPRLHAVTYRDIRAPGEPADNALPATDTDNNFQWPPGCAIRIATGPKPVGRAVEIRVEFDATTAAPEKLRIFVNSTECPAMADAKGLSRTYPVPEALMQDEAQVVEVIAPKGTPFKIVRLELFVAGAN